MEEKNETTQNVNLRFWEQFRNVPEYAQKEIKGGRLNGMTDINPVWRIKAMTDAFGPCGIGWKYEITKQWHEQFGNDVKSFTNINLYIKVDGEWSDPIPGTGGATLVESKGYVSDEGHKMSLTDALSVAMKSLGVAADIYFKADAKFDTKYNQQEYAAQRQKQATKAAPKAAPQPAPQPVQQTATDAELNEAFMLIKQNIESAPTITYLTNIYDKNPALHGYQPFMAAMSKRKKEIM